MLYTALLEQTAEFVLNCSSCMKNVSLSASGPRSGTDASALCRVVGQTRAIFLASQSRGIDVTLSKASGRFEHCLPSEPCYFCALLNVLQRTMQTFLSVCQWDEEHHSSVFDKHIKMPPLRPL